MQRNVFLDYEPNQNNGIDHGDDSLHKKSLRNGLVWLGAPSLLPGEDRLSPFAQVAVGSDRNSGRIPRVHDGMTLDDAVIITGLPRDEAARRIRRMKTDSNPKFFAETHLAVGAGEDYLVEMKNQAAAKKPPAPEAEIVQTPLEVVEKPSAKIINFPLLYGDQTRAVSNPLARCALFAAVQKRQYFKEWVYIGEIDGIKIEFQGEQWNQTDHDTFMQLLKMANHKPYGQEVEAPVRSILVSLGRQTHQSQRKQLFAEVERLKISAFRLTPPGQRSRIENLLLTVSTPQDQATLPQHCRNLSFAFNPIFAPLFESVKLSLFDCEERRRLGGNELAKWLHVWIIGNVEQYPHKVETIHQKCGSQDKTLYSFRQKLRRALDEIKAAKVIVNWRIDSRTDLVHIERKPTPAQIDHMSKKAKGKSGE